MNQEPRSPVAPVPLVKRDIEINHHRSAAKTFSSSSSSNESYIATDQSGKKRQRYITYTCMINSILSSL